MHDWLPGSSVAAVAAALSAAAAVVAWAWWRPPQVVHHGSAVLGVAAALSALAIVAIVSPDPLGVRLRLDPSEEPMIASDDPSRASYDEAVLAFGDDDVFIIGMQTDREAPAGVFTFAHLSALRSIGAEIRALPGVRSVESLADATEFRYVPEDDLIAVADFLDEIPSSPDRLAELRGRALSNPVYTRSLVSADGHTAAINVTFLPMTDGEFVEAGTDQAIRQIVDRHEDHDRSFFVTGRKHIKAQAHAIMVRDLLSLIPLAMLAGALVAWRMTGSLLAGILPVAASLVATVWVLGLLCALGRPLNIITIVLAPMLICVGSVYGVHVHARFEEFARRSATLADAAGKCIEYTTRPVLIAGVTTCLGFGALMLSETPAIQELGIQAVVGIASVTAIALTAFPVLLTRLPRAPMAEHTGDRIDAALRWIARTATERPTIVIAAWAFATAAAIALMPRIVIDTDYVSFFDAQSQVRRDFDTTSALLRGAMPVYVTLDGHVEGSFREPDNLRLLERLQREVDGIEGVSSTLSAVDFVKQLNQAFENGDPAQARIPDTRGEVAELLFLVPKGQLRRFADSSHSRVNLLVRTGWSGSSRIRELENRLEQAIRTVGLPPGMTSSVTGKTILVNHVADRIAGNQFLAVGFATVTMLLLVAWATGSWSFGAIAMIPNVVPVLIYFGILGAGAATLSLPTSLIGCIALGIAIDDTAHFTVAYQGRRGEGMSPVDAAVECIVRLGRPIVITSVMLVAGFLVFLTSGFATLRELGALLAVTMLLCLGADLLLLSAVLVRTRT